MDKISSIFFLLLEVGVLSFHISIDCSPKNENCHHPQAVSNPTDFHSSSFTHMKRFVVFNA